MKINARGQVTIPRAIRQKLGLVPRCEVKVDVIGDSVRIRRARKATGKTRGEMIVARLRGTGTKRYRSTDELMKLLRGGN